MKKWQKITAASVAVIVLLIIGGVLFYKLYLVPRYIKPVAEKFSEYVQNDRVLDGLYAEAKVLHDDGILDDSVYTNFVNAYNKHNRNDLEYAREILAEQEAEQDIENENHNSNSLSARYASNQVGVEIIQTNDGIEEGKSTSSYSDVRTSDRKRVEDIVEAEKIISESEKTPGKTAEATDKPQIDEKSAYELLKANMTTSEFTTFSSLMTKLDREVLKSFLNNADKEGLKEYLHSRLNDNDYKSLVNLGYKYAYLFIDEQ